MRRRVDTPSFPSPTMTSIDRSFSALSASTACAASASSSAPKGWSTLFLVWVAERDIGSEVAETDPNCVSMTPSCAMASAFA